MEDSTSLGDNDLADHRFDDKQYNNPDEEEVADYND
jgi:hypothetical protein